MFEWNEDKESYDQDENRSQGYGNFIKPLPGTYLAEVTEGAELRHNDKSGKFSIKIPLKLIKAVQDERGNGDPAAEGAEVADFISPSFEFTMKRLGFLISISKVRDNFTKKYAGIPAYGEPEFEPFIMDVKRHLPSTRVIVTLAVSKGTSKPMLNVRAYRKATGSSLTPGTLPDQSPGW